MLRFMGLQRVGHDRATELNRTEGASVFKFVFKVIKAVLTVHSDFGAQENKVCHLFHFSPYIGPWNLKTWDCVTDSCPQEMSYGQHRR